MHYHSRSADASQEKTAKKSNILKNLVTFFMKENLLLSYKKGLSLKSNMFTIFFDSVIITYALFSPTH